MTVTSQNSYVTYVGNSATTVFPYLFEIPTGSNQVYLWSAATGTQLVDPGDYSITGLDDPAGGTVTYPLSGSPITVDFTLTISRVVPAIQATDISSQSNFYPAVIEDALDYLTFLIQQTNFSSIRAVLVPIGSPLPAPDYLTAVQQAAAAAAASAAVASGSIFAQEVASAGDQNPTAAQMGKNLAFTGAGPWTTILAASSVGNTSFVCGLKNRGTGILTVAVIGGTIDGIATDQYLYPGEAWIVYCNGVNWFVLAKFGNEWTTIWKLANEARVSTTVLADDAKLKFPVFNAIKYAFRGKIYFDTTAAADFKWRHVGPAAPTILRLQRRVIIPGGAADSAIAVDTAFSAADITAIGVGTTGGWVEFDGILQNGINPGTFSIQWAQNTSDPGNTTVLAGSQLEYKIIG